MGNLSEQIQTAVHAMTDCAAYSTKYQRARIRLDPEYREKVNQYHREYLRQRYATDSEYRERKIQAAKLRQQQRKALVSE